MAREEEEGRMKRRCRERAMDTVYDMWCFESLNARDGPVQVRMLQYVS